MRTRPVAATPVRAIFGLAGWCAVALAVAGVVVPGLPTTVFVLIASYCFSRSSPRFERWLRENRWLGPSLQRLASGGGLSRQAKRGALTAMWTAVLLSSIALAAMHWALALGTIGLGLLGTLSILFGVRTVPDDAAAATLIPEFASGDTRIRHTGAQRHENSGNLTSVPRCLSAS